MSVVGIDVGTSRVKAVRFDENWVACDTEGEDTTVATTPDGRSEQDMLQVRTAVFRVLAAVTRRSPDPVRLVSVTAQGDGCWLVDRDRRPVGPALLWNDSRSSDLVARWQHDGTLQEIFDISGSLGAAGLAHAQLRWLTDHAPDVPASADRLLSCGSWVFHELTGQLVLEASDAANPFLDARTGHPSPRVWELAGIPELERLLPPVVTGADRIAAVTTGVAADVGLAPGTPVALAPYDVVATAAGTGTTRPGQAFAVLGTTLCIGTVTDDPSLDRPANGMTLPTGVPHRWLLAYATMTGTEVLDWTARLMGLAGAADVIALAAQSTSTVLPALRPYLSPAGERSPFLDPAIRGTLGGLSLRHTRADVARAAVDGLTLAIRDCLDAAGGARRLALSGGGARSELWCQTISDATGVPIDCPDTSESGTRGAALVGATDLGWFTSLDAAADVAVRPRHTHEPDDREHRRLSDAYAAFRLR
jgi:erythritol kinase